MTLGILNVAGAALGAAFSLLVYASIIQGFRHDVESPRYDQEAVVGQNITPQCLVEKLPGLKMVNIEWKKNHESTKLAMFSQDQGDVLFWPNLTLHFENSDKSMGSYLHLPEVNTWDSGIYICDIATFPYGTFRRETELKIKDVVEITYDTNSSLEVANGQNVTILCRASPDAEYRWTKFTIPVQTATTHSETDSTTTPPSSSSSFTRSSALPETTNQSEDQTPETTGPDTSFSTNNVILTVRLTLVVMVVLLSGAALIFCKNMTNRPREPPVETDPASVPESDPVYDDIGDEGLLAAAAVEISPDYSNVKYSTTQPVTAGDDDNFVTAATSQHNADDSSG